MRTISLGLLAWFFAAGCNCGSGSRTDGGGADGTDAAADAAPPGGDGGTGADGGPGGDGGPASDGGGIGTDAAPVSVNCEGTTCTTPDECCVSAGTGGPAAACVPAGTCGGDVWACDGEEDCPMNMVCCGTAGGAGGGAVGPTMCAFDSGGGCPVRLCTTAAQCPGGNCLVNPSGPGRYCP